MGLAPNLVEMIFELIVKINKTGVTAILLIEQNANMALQIADRGYVRWGRKGLPQATPRKRCRPMMM